MVYFVFSTSDGLKIHETLMNTCTNIKLSLLGRLFRVDLINLSSMSARPSVRTYVRLSVHRKFAKACTLVSSACIQWPAVTNVVHNPFRVHSTFRTCYLETDVFNLPCLPHVSLVTNRFLLKNLYAGIFMDQIALSDMCTHDRMLLFPWYCNVTTMGNVTTIIIQI